MFIKFGFGDETNYVVSSFNFSLGTSAGDTKLTNVVPGELSVTLEIPPDANPASEFLQFAVDQHNTAKDKGSGKLVVYKGENVGESLQEITFSNGWITDIDMSGADTDEKFSVDVTIAAADLTVSGIAFTHRARSEHFPK